MEVQETQHFASRNETIGFAHRTRKNFLFIENAFQHGEDVHVVTQLVTSMLGLVVFPWERKFQEHVKELRVDDLVKEGWPQWNMTGQPCDTLGDLVGVLRHAVAHGHVKFSSDSRTVDEVLIEFENRPNDPLRHWRGSISGGNLRTFCLKFIQLVDNSVG